MRCQKFNIFEQLKNRKRFLTKAQISIFVIIGIIIIIITGILVYKINQNRLKQIQLSLPEREKIRPVIEYVDECIEKTTVNALTKLGNQGLIYPTVYLASKNRKIAYFYFQGKNYFPDIKEINKQISQYVKENIKECTGDFSETKFAVEDSPTKISAESFFKEDYINISINYPMKVFTEGQEINVREFSTKLKTNFISIHKVSENIFLETKKNPGEINLDFINQQEYDMKLIKIDKSTLVYEITDSIGLENKPYRYRFAVKYEI